MKIFIHLKIEQLDMEGAKSPRWLRIAEIILGAIAIGLAGFVLSNPDFTVALVALMLSFALIIIGISESEAAVALKFFGVFGGFVPIGGVEDEVGVADASLVELLIPIEFIA